MKKHFRLQSLKENGFTLIELLVAIVVFGVLSGIITITIFTSLRNASKTAALEAVRQNGNIALLKMAGMIRDARNLSVPASCGLPASPTATSSVTIVNADNNSTTFDCSGTPLIIASNSASSTPASQPLIDTTNLTITSCSFTCSQASSRDAPIITITFALQQSNPSNLPEKTASATFQTAVVMRNTVQ